jgi:hypothetical protein
MDVKSGDMTYDLKTPSMLPTKKSQIPSKMRI